METIIFRGKRIDNGEWVYGYYRSNDMGNHFITETEREDTYGTKIVFDEYEVEKDTVGMFTGRFDKKGNAVYTDDVLKKKYRDGNTTIGTVSYCDGEFGVDGGDDLLYENFKDHRLDRNVYVVGNTHDKGQS